MIISFLSITNLCLDVGNCNYYVLHDNQTNKLDVKKYIDL